MTKEELEAMSVNDIKALIYDNMVLIERANHLVGFLSAELQKRASQQKPEEKAA